MYVYITLITHVVTHETKPKHVLSGYKEPARQLLVCALGKHISVLWPLSQTGAVIIIIKVAAIY